MPPRTNRSHLPAPTAALSTAHLVPAGVALTLAFSLAIAFALVPATRADVTTSYWNNTASWGYQIVHMPDFDQRRDSGPAPGGGFAFGLPGNGSMYCVPTSTVNMLAYMANHGFPELADPGYAPYYSWKTPAKYNDATFVIDDVGSFMDTHPEDGTGGGDWYHGTVDWLDGYGLLDKFTVQLYYLTPDFVPNLNTMGFAAIGGSLVSFGYGKYENGGIFNDLIVLGDRVGGHVVTFSHGSRAGGNLTLGVRDPADDPDKNVNPDYLQTQSSFGNRYYTAENHEVFLCAGFQCGKLMTTLNYNPSADYIYLIDGFLGIKPKQGYAFTETGVGQINIVLWTPFTIEGSGQPQIQIAPLPGVPMISAVAMKPDNGFLALVPDATGGPTQIFDIDPIAQENESIASVPGALGMALGRNGLLYVASENDVLCLNPQAQEPITATALLPEPAAAVTFSDFTDDVILISSTDRVLMFYRKELPAGVPPTMQDLPVLMELGEEVVMMAEPAAVGERIWIGSEASSMLYALKKGARDFVQTLMLPDDVTPTGLSMDDRGHLFVTTTGGLMEFMETAAAGWQMVPAEESFFAGFDTPITGPLHVTCTRSNFEPAIHGQPGWTTNLDPEELTFGDHVEDCDGDLDDDGEVAVPDLLELLSAWGLCDICPADYDDDREVGVPDLLELLAMWGPCPR